MVDGSRLCLFLHTSHSKLFLTLLSIKLLVFASPDTSEALSFLGDKHHVVLAEGDVRHKDLPSVRPPALSH